jgi:putative resolvase
MARTLPGDWLSATAAARLGVSSRTLRRCTQTGKLPDVRGAGGRRVCRAGDLGALTSMGGEEGRTVGYARVSSRRQQAEGDLGRQAAQLWEADGAGMAVYTGVASGLSDRWPGPRRALKQGLVRGMLAIVTSVAGRLYEQRSAKARWLRAVVDGEAGRDAG